MTMGNDEKVALLKVLNLCEVILEYMSMDPNYFGSRENLYVAVNEAREAVIKVTSN